MVDTQRVHNTWLHKADFSFEDWAKLLATHDYMWEYKEDNKCGQL